MNSLISPLSPGTYVIAIEDAHTWDVMNYTNLYVLKRTGQTILIDAGMKKYQGVVIDALAQIGVTPDEVTHLLLTHGHVDHAGGAGIFKQAKKFVHHCDVNLLPSSVASQFITYFPRENDYLFSVEDISELDIIHVNTHTPGSVVLYDHLSKALFAGDFFCFFGEALPEGMLVSYSDVSRQGSYQYVAEQAAGGGGEFDSFMTGLSRLLSYQPDFFCTGHGVVLKSEIQSFMKCLWQNGTSQR